MYNEIQLNSSLAKKFTETEIEYLKSNDTLDDYTWHHHNIQVECNW
ncbi:HNH endonuclease [Priestia aryabhattai]